MSFPLQNLASKLSPRRENADVDAIDIRLLELLSADGRASLKSLATAVGLSSPAVSDRITRLTKKGVITGFSASVDWDLLGYSAVAYLSITVQAGHDQASVMERLIEVDGVEEVSVITGAGDLLVRIRVKDLDDLRVLLAQGIWPVEGLAGTETLIALHTAVAPQTASNRFVKLNAALQESSDR